MKIMLTIIRVVHILTLIAFAHSDYYIESSDGGIVNCVDRMAQPAFDNTLLRNHKFQESPSKIPTTTTKSNTKSKWRTTEAHVSIANCPRGTVPLRQDDASEYPGNNTSTQTTHEYADKSTDDSSKLYGAKATINIWDPKVENKEIELSISQLWISSGDYAKNNLSTIEVGCQVYPQLYTDNKPRLFIYWTSDAYQTTGCYNLRCAGFVQTSRSIVLGGAIGPVSVFAGRQYEITIQVWKDQNHGNWWLSIGPDNSIVGYWPAELFPNLDYADEVHWGGEIVDSHKFDRHTKTQMGSGHFPFQGFGKASYFRNLEIVDSNNFQPIQRLKINANHKYYDVKNLDIDEEWGTHFFYGGPGFSDIYSGVVPLRVKLYFICFGFGFFIII
ncbi:hypothetical protein IGI04_027557 [Brassica rapa subsp. trilocularis]|uniref:Neprosin PEP catalytic domain-containing protein n=1 Tax=Brassica rapa subsp. trilocularis TaxID=1813537 RepID=A0ABQ7L1P2_BRACM|nr:hypothetical protein IGI04_027557 [Brassica rapa subsp. trilocularis]